MNIAVYERLVLSAVFQDNRAMFRLAAEIPDVTFGYGPGDVLSQAHQLIYRAMVALYLDQKPIDVVTVAHALGSDLTRIGGEAYLAEVAKTTQILGMIESTGLEEWAQIIDGAGRLRRLSGVLTKYQGKLDNLSDIQNVDEFFADLLVQIGHSNTVTARYKHISLAVEEFKRKLAGEADGTALSWLPVGWEASKRYNLLPRSSLVTIIGLSSSGKSQLLAQFLLGCAIQLKYTGLPGIVVLNTYEMKGDIYAGRMASCLAGVNLKSDAVRNKTGIDYRRLMDAADFIQTLPILWDDGDMASTEILSHTMALAAEHEQVHVVGIDYSELVPDKGPSEEQRVGKIFRNAQSLSRKLDAATVVLSQVSGDAFANETRLAGAWATRYSKAGWHQAEIELEIYNPPQLRESRVTYRLPNFLVEGDDYAYVIVRKNKNGPLGYFPLKWTPGIVRFSDPALAAYGVDALYENLENLWTPRTADF